MDGPLLKTLNTWEIQVGSVVPLAMFLKYLEGVSVEFLLLLLPATSTSKLLFAELLRLLTYHMTMPYFSEICR